MNYKVAILYICTGKYDVFWKEFYESYEGSFLCDSQKHYFVFTDADKIEYEENENIHKIFQERLGWPYDTLMRYQIFMSIEEQLKYFDYIYFMNANCKCVSKITEEEFCPVEKDILVVQHPAFYNKKRTKYTYDNNPKSTAFIPRNKGQYYICGGINGGKASAYLSLIKELKDNIDKDLKDGIIARWHDESHINHFIVEHDNWMMLSPSYCYAEDWDLPFEQKILVREKSKYFDSAKMKKGRWNSLFHKLTGYMKQWIRKKK